jgi:NAD(P)H-dependent FMN reductase
MVDETNPTAETPAASPELNINDLAAMKSIIDVASQRGAFKPNEMVPVGTVYAKLEAFLAAAQASQAAQAPAAPQAAV